MKKRKKKMTSAYGCFVVYVLTWPSYYRKSGNTLAAADSQIWNVNKVNKSYSSSVVQCSAVQKLLLTKVTSKKIPSFSSTLIKYCVCSMIIWQLCSALSIDLEAGTLSQSQDSTSKSRFFAICNQTFLFNTS